MSMNPPTAPASKGPNWMLIGTGAAVVLGVVTLLSKNSGGGTTAAGTSINAALGSLQEEQMNTQGQIGLMQQSLGLGPNETLTGHMDANQAASMSTAQGNQNALVAWLQQLMGVAQNTQAGVNTVSTQVANVQTGVNYVGGQVAGVQSGVNEVSSQVANEQTGINYIGSQVAGVQSGLNYVSGQVANVQQQGVLSDVHNQINFNAVQAALNGNPNPIVAQQLMAATSGTY